MVTHRSQSWPWMIDSHPFRSMSITPPPPPTPHPPPHSSNKSISNFNYFKSWNYKVKVMGEVKGEGHIVHPVSNQCTSFWFHINRTNHSWDMSNIVFDLEKTHPKFSKKILQKQSFQQNCFKIWSGAQHDQRDIAIKFCSDWLSDSHFILQTNQFLFINVTAMTSGQGH